MEGPRGSDHAANRLALHKASVGVPDVPGVGEVGYPMRSIPVRIILTVEQPGCEPGLVGGRCEDEIDRRSALGLGLLANSLHAPRSADMAPAL